MEKDENFKKEFIKTKKVVIMGISNTGKSTLISILENPNSYQVASNSKNNSDNPNENENNANNLNNNNNDEDLVEEPVADVDIRSYENSENDDEADNEENNNNVNYEQEEQEEQEEEEEYENNEENGIDTQDPQIHVKSSIHKNHDIINSVKQITISYNKNCQDSGYFSTSPNAKMNFNIVEVNINNETSVLNMIENIVYEMDLLILIFDITKMKSFIKVKKVVEYIQAEVSTTKIILVSNKLDLDPDREVSGFEIKEFKDEYPRICEMEISLLNKQNASDLLDLIMLQIIEGEKENFTRKNIVLFPEENDMKKYSNFMNDSSTFPIKLFLLGDSSVGKTCFIKRYCENEFFENLTTTVGVDVEKKLALISDNLYRVELWDTAGQEKLRSIPRQYYCKGDGFILMYDVTNRGSFENIERWVKSIRDESIKNTNTKQTLILLVGNKIDNTSLRIVSREEAEFLSKQFKISYAEISCKNGINVHEVMTNIILDAFQNVGGDISTFMLKKKKENNNKKCCDGN